MNTTTSHPCTNLCQRSSMQRWNSNLVLGMWAGLPDRLKAFTVGAHWEHPDKQGFRHEQSRVVLADRRGFSLEFLMATELECCWDGPDYRPSPVTMQPVGSCRHFQDTQINMLRYDACRDLCSTIALERWESTRSCEMHQLSSAGS